MHVVILAGGGGTRLWPLSREDFPKQFLNFGSQESLLQKTVNRFLHTPLVEKIVVSTNCHYESLVTRQLEKIDPDKKIHVLVEPFRKNTAPAIALAVKFLQEILNVPPNASVLILPSDHLIEPEHVFLKYLDYVAEIVHSNRIVTFGIRPTKPETGYGYIKIGEKLDFYTHRVEKFIEKPDLSRAQNYLASGKYYWNAGMFAFSISTFWQELQKHAANIYSLMKEPYEKIKERYDELPNLSIDYALMEKTDQIAICPLPVSWSDVGSWDSLYDVMEKDQNHNVKIGNVLDLDTKNSLIFGGKRLISTIGLEDILIIETDDVTLISKKGDSQRVKKIIEELSKNKKEFGEIQRYSSESTNEKKQLHQSGKSMLQMVGKLMKIKTLCKRFLSLFSPPQKRAQLKDFLPPKALIFDIGANIGNKTKKYLSWGAAKVVCLEPQPSIATKLQKRFKRNEKVVVVRLGVSDKLGTISFSPFRDGTLATACPEWKEGRFKHETWETPIEIPTTTIDQLIQEYGVPDFCKIDVEGHEWNAVMGLSQPIPLLNFEFAYEWLEQKTKPCLERLEKLGYRKFNVALGESDEYSYSEWPDSHTLFSYLINHPDKLLWGDIYAKQ